MKKKHTHIPDFTARQIPTFNNELRDIWDNLGKVDYEKVSSASTAPTGGSHADLKLLNDGTNKVLWVNISGTWTNIGNLISSLVSHVHSSTAGQGGQLDWDNIWSDAVHSHQSNAEGAKIDHGLALDGLADDDHCFSEDTEILTKNGFIPYEEIKIGDEALTLNLETNELEYNKIKAKYVYTTFDQLVSFKNRYGEILVTPNHKMLYKNTCKIEKNPKSKYLTCTAKEALNKSVFNIPVNAKNKGEKYKKPLEFFKLLGLIISEGHFYNPKNSGYGIAIYQLKDHADYIENILTKLKIPYIKRHGPTEIFYIRSNWARKNIRTWITEKRISNKLMNLRDNEFRAFLAGLLFSDGSKRSTIKITKENACDRLIDNFDGKVRYSYYTGDSVLKDQLCHLLTLNNLRGYSYFRKLGYIGSKGCWSINITNKENILFNKYTKKIINYNGNVWCVSVKNETLVLRRNGLIFITGNSQYHNDTRGDARYFTETEHINTSVGAGDVGKPIKLDADGQVDATMINDADIDHNSLTNYDANQHRDTTAWAANLVPDGDGTRDLGSVGATDFRWKDLKLSGNLDDETNQVSVTQCKTAYDHSQDNSQAHSDYILNNDSDTLQKDQNNLTTLTIQNNTAGNAAAAYFKATVNSGAAYLGMFDDGFIDSTFAGKFALVCDSNADGVFIQSQAGDIELYSAVNVEIDATETKIGDVGGGNYLSIESDGTLEFNGTATVFGVITIPVNSMIRSVSAPPALTGYKAGYSFGFDAATQEIATFRIELPPDYKEGTDIVFYVHWTPSDNGAGNVVWRIDYSWANVDAAFPVDTEVSVTVAADGVTDKHQRDAFSAFSGTGKTIGSVLLCSIMRYGDNVADTYANDVLLHCLSVHYEKDTIGSRQITTK